MTLLLFRWWRDDLDTVIGGSGKNLVQVFRTQRCDLGNLTIHRLSNFGNKFLKASRIDPDQHFSGCSGRICESVKLSSFTLFSPFCYKLLLGSLTLKCESIAPVLVDFHRVLLQNSIAIEDRPQLNCGLAALGCVAAYTPVALLPSPDKHASELN
jgi:hypothetical protein